MADEPNSAPTPGNAPEARTPTGEILDQQAKQPDGSANQPPVKTEAELAAEAAKAGDKKPEAPVVPDKYEFKAPEGFALDDALIAEATPLFKELGLSQEGAQKLFDFHAKALGAASEAPTKAYETMRDTWRQDVIADKALGDGKGDLKPEVKAAIAKTIDAMPNAKEFREAMNLTGVGDNPAFVRAFYHLATQLSEGTPVRGSGPSPAGQTAPNAAPKSAAQSLYPNLPSSASS